MASSRTVTTPDGNMVTRLPKATRMDLVIGTLALRPYVFVFLALFLVAGSVDVGWRRTLVFGAAVWPVAWLAEFASTRVGFPFGLYHYTGLTRGRELYVGDVPFMDSLSLTLLAYAAFALARVVLRGRSAGRGSLALLAGFLMMLLDVVIDPVAVRGDRWFLGYVFYYPDGGSYFGVPLANFAGWWIVGTLAVGTYLVLAGEMFGRRAWPGVAVYYAVLGFNLAGTAWLSRGRLLASGAAVHAVLPPVQLGGDRRGARPPSHWGGSAAGAA